MTGAVTHAIDDVAMNDVFIQLASTYGIAGVIIALVAWLLYKLIDRGFTFEVPPRKE